MALRLLMYIARVYEKILGDKNLYASRALTIPRPEFFVLYNGTAPYPDEEVLRLSDAFPDPASLGLPGKESPALDLVVRVININEGRNEEVVKRCTVLNGYSAFVARVREYERELGNKEEAMKAAIRYCREHDILKEFLERHSSEVMNMLLTEWNWDDALAVRYEEGREEGREEGLETGREEGLVKGIERGLEKGREETAQKALMKGMTPEDVSEITGLDLEAVAKIAGR
jgi:hypothetical protein